MAGEFITDNRSNMNLINPMLEDSEVIDTFKSISDKYIYEETTLDEAARELNSALRAIG